MKKKLKDVLIRTLKTFIVTGIAAVAGMGLDNPKAWLITFCSAGGTAVLNMFIKLLENDDEEK